MNKSEFFKKCHKMVRDIIKKGDDYRATLSLVMSFMYSNSKVKIKEVVLKNKKVSYGQFCFDI